MVFVSQIYRAQYIVRQWLVGQCYRIKGCHSKTPDVAPRREPERVVIVVAGLIGDSVMSTPLLIEARRLWPKARLVVLGQKHNCELLKGCPLVDECVQTPGMPFSLGGRSKTAELRQWLRSERFDVAVIALGDQFAAVLAEAKIPVRVGVQGHCLEPCLTLAYDIGCARTWGPSERLNALRVLGAAVHDVGPELWVAEAARIPARQRLVERGLKPSRPYAIVHPFGSTLRQHWPLEQLELLADGLRREYGLTTIVIGGPETRNRLPPTLHGLVVDATAALNIPELLAAIDESKVVISTDSGPFHIAGALRRPTIGLFRSRRPEHARRYASAIVIFGEDDSCEASCDWDRCSAIPCGQMRSLSAKNALDAVCAILSEQCSADVQGGRATK